MKNELDKKVERFLLGGEDLEELEQLQCELNWKKENEQNIE